LSAAQPIRQLAAFGESHPKVLSSAFLPSQRTMSPSIDSPSGNYLPRLSSRLANAWRTPLASHTGYEQIKPLIRLLEQNAELLEALTDIFGSGPAWKVEPSTSKPSEHHDANSAPRARCIGTKKEPSAFPDSLIEMLEKDSSLQQQLAFALDYVPSRWLLEHEIPVVISSRHQRCPDLESTGTWDSFAQVPPFPNAYDWAREHHLTGICLSGGGIRSATFNLGVLQALAQLDILRRFDYISSVSGGGYIHEWLAGWIKREDLRLKDNASPPTSATGFSAVNDALRPVPFDSGHPFTPTPIRWLRLYSNYLTPRKGLFSADTWVAVAIWVRNTLLNQIILVSFLFSLVLIPHLITAGWRPHRMAAVGARLWETSVDLLARTTPWWFHQIGVSVATATATFLAASIVLWVGLQQEYRRVRYDDIFEKACKKRRSALISERRALMYVVIPLFASAILVTLIMHRQKFSMVEATAFCALLFAQLAGMAIAGGVVRAYRFNHNVPLKRRVPMSERWERAKAFVRDLWKGPSNDNPQPEARERIADTQQIEKKQNVGFFRRLRNRWTFARARDTQSPFAAPEEAPPVAPTSTDKTIPWYKNPWSSLVESVRAKLWHSVLAPLFGLILMNSLLATFGAAVVICLGAASLGFHCQSSDIPRLDRLMIHVPRIALKLNREMLLRVQLTLGPPLFVLFPFLGMVLMAGLVGRNFADWLREWIARIRSWCLLLSFTWIGYFGLVLLGPLLVQWFQDDHYHWKIIGSIKWTAIIGWVIGTAAGVLAGKSKKASGTAQDSSDILNLIAVIGPYVFIVGLLLLLATLADFAVTTANESYRWLIGTPIAIFVIFGWRVDINEFSMNPFYRNRLTRCYLGATNPRRDPSPLTGLDDRDTRNLQISRLQPSGNYSGPLPIINTTLNISSGQDLAYQERKAASFFFSPVFSGYTVGWTSGKKNKGLQFNGFVPTSHYYCPDGGINIATAAAISGAAASPNSGFHTNPAAAFLMTIFNVRLGWWIANPRLSENAGRLPSEAKQQSKWPSPTFAPFQLGGELLGMSDDASEYVYLSDGGHFDNMGLYELVRRRCHRIVICDAECDEDYNFDGLGMAIRKCRIDFGVEIVFKDLSRLREELQSRNSKTHFATGTIRYPETPENSDSSKPPRYQTGTILYLKSSLTGDAKWERDPKKTPPVIVDLDAETVDIMNYKLQHDSFPHDTTANQWFTESQFESYRRLGQHIVEEVESCNGWNAFMKSPPRGNDKSTDQNSASGKTIE
jgi:hypothetical protein